MVRADEAFKAGCFGAAGVWFFLVAAPIILVVLICGGMGIFSGVMRSRANHQPQQQQKVAPAAQDARIEKAKPPIANLKAESNEPEEVEIVVIEPPGIGEDPNQSPEAIAARKKAGDLAGEQKREKAEAKKRADDKRLANAKLAAAKSMMSENPKAARKRLQEIIDKWPDSDAAKEARGMLK